MRYSGSIGLRQAPVEISPGVFTESIREVKVTGELRRESVRWHAGERSQNSPKANHILSILATDTTVEELMEAAYVTWQGRKWTVLGVEYMRPRLNLNLGGVYNE